MSTTLPAQRTGVRLHVQKFGTALSNMVMPNIGAFIAWGLITALFIEVGWLAKLGIGDSPGSWVAEIGGWGEYAGGGIVGPMITYLLPILIGYTGGRMVHDTRGGVVGAIATMGVVAGTEIPMFLGAMIMGPLGGWTMKRLDALWDGSIRPGFEMLVNNFSAGIWGAIVATFGFFVMSPVVTFLSDRLGDGVDFLVDNSLLPLTSLIIEPAKVLFLNNAINHGVLTPLGTTEALEEGKSVLFLLEANPGPGLGLLLAYMVFGRGIAKASAPGAAIIHFLGGIHEIYFPYVLMKPKLIVAMIAGGMTGVFVNVVFDVGLRAPAAPGSVFAVYAQTASDSYVGVTLSMLAAAGVTFLVAALLLRGDTDGGEDLAGATASMEAMKGKRSIASSALAGSRRGTIERIVFACDAGMGSSAMGASVLRRKIQAAGFGQVSVVNQAIANLTDTFDLVVTHRDLTDRARQKTPSALHVSVEDFMSTPRYDEIVELLAESGSTATAPEAPAPADAEVPGSGGVLSTSSIVLSGTARTRDEAITEAGELLVAAGVVDPSYVTAMHEREKSVSTHMGNGLAIPHGTNEAKAAVRRTGISFVRYAEPVDWNGKPAEFVIGIAGTGNEHLGLLGQIAHVFLDKDQVARLRAARTEDDVRAVLDGVHA
ncbi:PTS system mannitol-specific IIC component [Nocardioides aromaticivorans]|uniref:Mannitol-specific phosphotransferase enzyme IIA component n=1 Tax=Nocardioides aromaticivorans TaxID=200618 RepID=A0A7Z0CLA9_9ACTN|nr:PTS mannitol transporter subunit IICBA [Nocardioides aromaticivorans]NYI45074.1 PTS system mannitol-specific IIC component [Nocardioides aromaticivorans]